MSPVTDCMIWRTQEGKSALHQAAEKGHEDIADILLSNKAFVNAKTKLGLTPLHLSAKNGSFHLVQLLIKTHQACIDALSLVRVQLFAQLCMLH